ncbi:unnamed protein product, partial [marine sediment metagenome]
HFCLDAIGVIVEMCNTHNSNLTWGLRRHGSTDNRHRAGPHQWAVFGLDANQHIDIYYDDFPNDAEAFNLVGYITAGATFYDNGHDITPLANDAYQLVGLAGYLANPIMAFIELDSGVGTEDWAIRKNWACGDIYSWCGNHNFAIVHPNTPNGNIEMKLSHADIELYLVGIA